MTDRFEETFEALLGSVKDKIKEVERPEAESDVESDASIPNEFDIPTGLDEDDDPLTDHPAEPHHVTTGVADGDTEDDATDPNAPGSVADVVVSEADVERYVKLAKGSYLVPNYVSDYLMKNLSLGEQSVFHRLYRLSRGFHRKTEPITVRNLAESCGLNPKLTANIIKALASKRLLKIIYSNPFTKKVKFKLVLPREVEQKMVICGVCHNLIMEDETWQYYPITKPENGRSQAITAHESCVEGSPILEGRAPSEE